MNEFADKHLKRATLASISVASILIVMKIVAWVLTGSISILASLLDSIFDALASLVNFFAIRYSLEPPDKEHPFGHGKVESIAGLAQGTFIAGSAAFLFFEAFNKIFNPVSLNKPHVGIVVILISIAFTIALTLYQKWVIKKTKSIAIEADFAHYIGDLLTNMTTLLAIFLATKGFLIADPILGIVIASFISKMAYDLIHKSFHNLLDHRLPLSDEEKIQSQILEHPQVFGIHNFRTRQSGLTVFIQFHLELNDKMPLIQAHEIAEEIEENLKGSIPNADVIIHQDPVSHYKPNALKKNTPSNPKGILQ